MPANRRPAPPATPPRPLPERPRPQRRDRSERTVWDRLADIGITPDDIADWVARA